MDGAAQVLIWPDRQYVGVIGGPVAKLGLLSIARLIYCVSTKVHKPQLGDLPILERKEYLMQVLHTFSRSR